MWPLWADRGAARSARGWRLNRLEAGRVGAEDLTPKEVPFLRFDPVAQELFDSWRTDLEQRLRFEGDRPVLLSHLAK